MDLQPNDTVEVTQADKKHECVYVGQRGRIVEVYRAEALVHLRCGHVWNVALTALRKLEAAEAVAPAVRRAEEVPVVELPEDETDWQNDVSDEE